MLEYRPLGAVLPQKNPKSLSETVKSNLIEMQKHSQRFSATKRIRRRRKVTETT